MSGALSRRRLGRRTSAWERENAGKALLLASLA
jgi:hypothetical protein